MKNLHFIFALHNHQPVGNFDHVIEAACDRAYSPFLDVLEAHPKITCVLHNTGCLAAWLLEHKPEYFKRLRRLVKAGRLEILSGGFYEPILPVIPETDRIAQIEKLSEFVKKHCRYEAQGMWLAERVWEPGLPSTMRDAGMRFTVLDDSHFHAAGLKESDTLGYYMTEDQGKAVAVFPTLESLRYHIPFQPVEKTMALFEKLAEAPGTPLAVFGDDGEKFGVWPGTHESVYGEGWLDDFFTALEDNADWIKLTTFSKALESLKPLGRVYLPTASYIEMMTWALPAQSVRLFEEFRESLEDRADFKDIQSFARGGFWRNFLTKYEESNHIHKRMLRTSAAVAKAEKTAKSKKAREAAAQARDLLMQGQCNCAYWHGVFGGLYLPHLRSALFDRLIGADAVLHKETGNKTLVERVDFDGDGHDEIVVETPALGLILHPAQGGALVEIDDARSRTNLTDTLTRRPEAYHAKVAEAVTWEEAAEKEKAAAEDSAKAESIHDIVRSKEKGLEKLLIFDWYRRSSGLARFLAGFTTLEDFASGDYLEDGDFVNQPFKVERAGTLDDGSAEVVLTRKGGLYQQAGVRWTTLRRTILVDPKKPRFTLRHKIENTSDLVAESRFGVEFAINFLAPDAADRYVFVGGRKLKAPRLGATGEEQKVETFGMADEWKGLRVTFNLDKPATLWRLPIETVSLSEAGFERVYQGTCLLPTWPLRLEPGEKADYSIEIEINEV